MRKWISVLSFSTCAVAQTSITAGKLNGIYNPLLYPGSDVGAKINYVYNSVCASTGCRIKIPAGSYTLTTAILFAASNKPAILEGDATGTTLTWGSGLGSGTAVTFQYGAGPGGGMRDLNLVGPSNTGSTTGFNCGGSNALRNAWFQNITIQKFGTGFLVGNNCYLDDFVSVFCSRQRHQWQPQFLLPGSLERFRRGYPLLWRAIYLVIGRRSEFANLF